MLDGHARLHGTRIGARDLERRLDFATWSARSRRLADALPGLGLGKGDRVAPLVYKGLEWAELGAATAEAGLAVVPILPRLVAAEIRFVVEQAEAAAPVVRDELLGAVEPVSAALSVPATRRIHFGRCACPAGWRSYEELIARAADRELEIEVALADPWTLVYTSGTTGRPKGVLRSHGAAVLLALVTEIELALHRGATALLLMPMCHANSLEFFASFADCGGADFIDPRRSFDPEQRLRTFAEGGVTFTSLVPSQYVMLLGVAPAVRGGLDLRRVEKLVISSALARAETELATMPLFASAGLFGLYGSSEAGRVTMPHPDERLAELATVGRERIGSAAIELLDKQRRELPDGEVASPSPARPIPSTVTGGNPRKPRKRSTRPGARSGTWRGVIRTATILLVDRESNRIISGGENIYPTEAEAVLARHPAVWNVVVIGLPDHLWGERVHAVLALEPGATIDERVFLDRARPQLAGHERPRSLTVLSEADMPRTATGKIQHRALRDRLVRAAGQNTGP